MINKMSNEEIIELILNDPMGFMRSCNYKPSLLFGLDNFMISDTKDDKSSNINSDDEEEMINNNDSDDDDEVMLSNEMRKITLQIRKDEEYALFEVMIERIKQSAEKGDFVIKFIVPDNGDYGKSAIIFERDDNSRGECFKTNISIIIDNVLSMLRKEGFGVVKLSDKLYFESNPYTIINVEW